MKANKENQTVNVKIDTDLIAQHLHYAIGDHPNGAALVESIIGVGLVSGKLGHMFMGSLGVLPIQKYGIGEEVICNQEVYDYFNNEENAGYRKIGHCRVVEYRPYNDEQYLVEHLRYKKGGESYTDTEAVSAGSLSALPLQPPTEILVDL